MERLIKKYTKLKDILLSSEEAAQAIDDGQKDVGEFDVYNVYKGVNVWLLLRLHLFHYFLKLNTLQVDILWRCQFPEN